MDAQLRAGGAGALVGVAATVAMSGIMVAGRRLGLMSEQPPEEIVHRSAVKATGRFLSESQVDALATAAHLGFGAAGGAAFALSWSALRPAVNASLAGVLYATGIWAASYLGWIPALGLMPRSDFDERGRPYVMIAAHWLYGAVLGSVIARLTSSHRGADLGLR